MQALRFWLKVLLLIGVVGWLVIFTGVAFLVHIGFDIVLNFTSMPEPYFRLEGQTYSWFTLIRWVVGFVAWFIYGHGVWRKLQQSQK
jgi:uncharacterized membrane protein YphA (DoxX/SURF4 family)